MADIVRSSSQEGLVLGDAEKRHLARRGWEWEAIEQAAFGLKLNPSRTRNLLSIVLKTIEVDRLHGERDGKFPLRLLYEVETRCPGVDNPVAQAYIGGLLASTLTDDATDDSQMDDLELVLSMSSVQVYLHYTVYRSLHEKYKDIRVNFGKAEHRRGTFVRVPKLSEVFPGKTITNHELHVTFFTHLGTKKLIESMSMSQGVSYVSPSLAGFDLFKRVHGHSINSRIDFFDPALILAEHPVEEVLRHNGFSFFDVRPPNPSLYFPIGEGEWLNWQAVRQQKQPPPTAWENAGE